MFANISSAARWRHLRGALSRPCGQRRARWRRGVSDPGDTPLSGTAQPHAAVVEALEDEAYAEDDVMRVRHPQRAVGLNVSRLCKLPGIPLEALLKPIG